jgi:exopolyphosphatase / guanosine-5'-triphosphate,3'-diphosphate pyrophosphatase
MWPRADSGSDPFFGGDAAPGSSPQSLASPDALKGAAVIDVGSNSVRLVIYRLDGRAIWTVFNEKALAGLGRDMAKTGLLSADAVGVALTALRRFRAVLDGWPASDISVVATAAVRDAADGTQFLRRVREETGFRVRVLSGQEEAHYAALGVVAGQPDAKGVVGDLGGSSLELVRLAEGETPTGVTLPLGPFALGAPQPLEIEPTRRAIAAALAPIQEAFATKEFHAVGGAWRNLALLHMTMTDYPLRVAHQYELSRSDAVDVARFVARQSRSSLEGIQGLSRKRLDTLPYSALVLEGLIERLGIERVVISAYGLREGLLLEGMTPENQARDPLLEGCASLTTARGASAELGEGLERWLAPAFSRLEPLFADRDALLIAASCRLADLGSRLHPDHRADLAFDQVLRAPIAGMTHPERAFLACAAFARHSGAPLPQVGAITRVLSVERRQRAQALGAAVRLGCDLSGRNPSLLAQSDLRIEARRLIVGTKSGWADMLLGEQTAKRAATLANALKLKLQLGTV